MMFPWNVPSSNPVVLPGMSGIHSAAIGNFPATGAYGGAGSSLAAGEQGANNGLVGLSQFPFPAYFPAQAFLQSNHSQLLRQQHLQMQMLQASSGSGGNGGLIPGMGVRQLQHCSYGENTSAPAGSSSRSEGSSYMNPSSANSADFSLLQQLFDAAANMTDSQYNSTSAPATGSAAMTVSSITGCSSNLNGGTLSNPALLKELPDIPSTSQQFKLGFYVEIDTPLKFLLVYSDIKSLFSRFGNVIHIRICNDKCAAEITMSAGENVEHNGMLQMFIRNTVNDIRLNNIGGKNVSGIVKVVSLSPNQRVEQFVKQPSIVRSQNCEAPQHLPNDPQKLDDPILVPIHSKVDAVLTAVAGQIPNELVEKFKSELYSYYGSDQTNFGNSTSSGTKSTVVSSSVGSSSGPLSTDVSVSHVADCSNPMLRRNSTDIGNIHNRGFLSHQLSSSSTHHSSQQVIPSLKASSSQSSSHQHSSRKKIPTHTDECDFDTNYECRSETAPSYQSRLGPGFGQNLEHRSSISPVGGMPIVDGAMNTPSTAELAPVGSDIIKWSCRLELIDLFTYEPDFNVTNHILGNENANISYIMTEADRKVDISIKGKPVNGAITRERLHVRISSSDRNCYLKAVDSCEDLLKNICEQYVEYCIMSNLPFTNRTGFVTHYYYDSVDRGSIYVQTVCKPKVWLRGLTFDAHGNYSNYDQRNTESVWNPPPLRESNRTSSRGRSKSQQKRLSPRKGLGRRDDGDRRGARANDDHRVGNNNRSGNNRRGVRVNLV